MTKKIVYYVDRFIPALGSSAFVVAVDHPDFARGNRELQTSTVLSIQEDSFETLNTIYRKVEQLNG
jgi:hypothetical protein